MLLEGPVNTIKVDDRLRWLTLLSKANVFSTSDKKRGNVAGSLTTNARIPLQKHRDKKYVNKG